MGRMVYLGLEKLSDKGKCEKELEVAEEETVEFDGDQIIDIKGRISGNRQLRAIISIDEIPKEAQIAITKKTIEDLRKLLLTISQFIEEAEK